MSKFSDLGINIGLSIAGFFGSIMFIGKDGIKDFRSSLIAMFGGVASANYLTPSVCDLLDISTINHQFSVAFILGFIGLRGVEKIINKIITIKKQSI